MGWDFNALLRYDGPSTAVADALAQFESQHDWPAFDAVIEYARSQDYPAVAASWYQVPAWRSCPDWSEHVTLPYRPELPTLQATLDLPAGFSLMFGADAVRVDNRLRWIEFVAERGWRQPMLNAVKMFCEWFHATECIVTRDEHPAILAFLEGASFTEALQTAEEQDEGEFAEVDQLFIDKGYAENRVYHLDDGDYPIPMWDSRGYWRLPLTS